MCAPAFDKRAVMKNEKDWALAQKRHWLSTATVTMAKRPGMNPKKLGKLDNHKQEPWKAPLRKTVRETEFKVKPAHADFLSGAFFLKGFSPIAPPASEAPLLPEAYFFQPVSITRKRS